jgi:uncharacterized protein
VRTLSLAQARRIAIAAQGLADPRPTGKVDLRHARRVFDRVGMVQIDSVNVLARAHELALFSRLGPYPDGLLDRLAYERREVFEYWGHAASFVPTAHHPLFRHRMRRYAAEPVYKFLADAPPDFLDRVEAEIAERGAIQASELSDGGLRSGPWWGWSAGKTACELLFARGRLAVTGRRNFARVYDLAERALPAEVFELPTPDTEEAERTLLLLAARSCGVGTADDLADYPRLRRSPAKRLLEALADEGRLERVAVEGWNQPAYLHPEARVPRRVDARALLSPFDSLVWHRPRLERLFGIDYRIEIYVPKPKRVHGYYVLPFLLGDRIVGRVDLKADRSRAAGGSNGGRLLVQHAWIEPGNAPEEVAGALAAELRAVAGWLRLATIEVSDRGDLAWPLRAAVDR